MCCSVWYGARAAALKMCVLVQEIAATGSHWPPNFKMCGSQYGTSEPCAQALTQAMPLCAAPTYCQCTIHYVPALQAAEQARVLCTACGQCTQTSSLQSHDASPWLAARAAYSQHAQRSLCGQPCQLCHARTACRRAAACRVAAGTDRASCRVRCASCSNAQARTTAAPAVGCQDPVCFLS